MLAIARKRNAGKNIRFMKDNALEGLSFADNSFDCVCAAFVAHGFSAEERKKLYQEMKRVTRRTVVLNEFNRKKSTITNIVECMEKSDYHNFIYQVEEEMKEHFPVTQTIQVGSGTAWYVGEK
jgi:ubiquinone/menaquinone biosynthesis C-methylase UbiE